MEEGYKTCPYCGEDIKQRADKCHFCGKFLDKSETYIGDSLARDNRMDRLTYFRNLAILFISQYLISSLVLYPIIEKNGGWGDIELNTVIIYCVLCLIFIGIQIPRSIKRCHDIGWSGWLSILTILPISTIMFIILLFTPGTDGRNEYGEKPSG